ncbi:shock factor protein 1 [Seminavis robusta]|uniref:Shock factor protein 1 n=1 Tax=Seminavis robusta TaxID=568900 RepID=A0A9N8E6T4_9STRA|nr:shock factor protein 1 [Seminavis robusta]|eukprot:Sro683_g186670.1 shock factor protein 1 (420) ;mRNA; f:45701-47635
MLNTVENQGLQNIVGWQSSGAGFVVHNKQQFETQIMPKFFPRLKYVSFKRRLHLFGFRSDSKQDKRAFRHPSFARWIPEQQLLESIKATERKTKSTVAIAKQPNISDLQQHQASPQPSSHTETNKESESTLNVSTTELRRRLLLEADLPLAMGSSELPQPPFQNLGSSGTDPGSRGFQQFTTSTTTGTSNTDHVVMTNILQQLQQTRNETMSTPTTLQQSSLTGVHQQGLMRTQMLGALGQDQRYAPPQLQQHPSQRHQTGQTEQPGAASWPQLQQQQQQQQRQQQLALQQPPDQFSMQTSELYSRLHQQHQQHQQQLAISDPSHLNLNTGIVPSHHQDPLVAGLARSEEKCETSADATGWDLILEPRPFAPGEDGARRGSTRSSSGSMGGYVSTRGEAKSAGDESTNATKNWKRTSQP